MKKEDYKDQGLRQALQRRNEAAERMVLSEDFTDRLMQQIGKQDKQPMNRRYCAYIGTAIAIAASIALLIVIHSDKDSTGEQPSLIAQTDTTQTIIKNVEKQPLQKGKDTVMADSVKVKKERYRMPRPPKHYIANAETAESTPEPELMDTSELAERAFAEEMRLMRMMVQMQGNLQADFKGLTDEIRSRGERMSQHVEMALNEDEW